MENWKDIDGYEGFYQVSDMGRVRSLDRTVIRNNKTMVLKGKLLALNTDNAGYTKVSLCKESIVNQQRVHRLVSNAFLIKREEHKEVNHKDLNKSNNKIENLEWVTCKENSRHREDNMIKSNRGSRSGRTKLNVSQILEIRRIGNDFTQEEIARMFNISQGYVWAIKHKKVWNDYTIKLELSQLDNDLS